MPVTGAAAPLGVYLHVPFCVARCSYCAFYTVADDEARHAAYVTALLEEIQEVAERGRQAGGWRLPPQGGRPLDTVYLGGGTPSLLPAPALGRVLAGLDRAFGLLDGAELTLEANPETVTAAAARSWRAAGINRISLGAQTFDDRVLRSLGRRHGAAEIRAAVSSLRHAGFDNVSLDLIAGVHAEGLAADLEEAARLEPEHLSLYLLELDELEVGGVTPLAGRAERGVWCAPGEDWYADAYPRAVEFLALQGLARYEISNFARPGRACRHNLRYWRGEEVLGLGVAAHSFVAGRRFATPPDLQAYLLGRPAGVLDPGGAEERAAEAFFMGLRLDEGVDPAAILARWCVTLPPERRRRLDALARAGLLTLEPGRWRLTGKGVLLSNEVFQAFLP